MGVIVLILGNSGTGKSASMRNFKRDELGVINVASKPLPFRSNIATFNTADYGQVMTAITKAKTKSIVIDDCQYLMAFEFMRKANIKGYDKFTEIANNFYNLVQCAINNTAKDTIVYFMAHTETDANGNDKMKTIGKMLDEKITVEGMFTIVLKTVVDTGKYYFSTQNNGRDTVKSPMGMFDDYLLENGLIENDLKRVDEIIREYYGLNKENNTEDKPENKTKNETVKVSEVVNNDTATIY